MAAVTSSSGKSGWMPLSSSKGPESLHFQVDGAGPGAVITARGEGGKRGVGVGVVIVIGPYWAGNGYHRHRVGLAKLRQR